MKGWKRVLLILLLIPVVIAAILGGLYLYADNKPDIINGYEKSIQTGGSLEAQYLQHGAYDVKKSPPRRKRPFPCTRSIIPANWKP